MSHLMHTCRSVLPLALAVLAVVAARPAMAQAPDVLALQKVVINDPVAVNNDAFTLLMPQGWKTTGGVKWYMNLWHQASLEIQVANPNGMERLTTFPYCYFHWFANPIVPMPVGTLYNGGIIHPLMTDPRAVTKKFLLPMLPPGTNPVITGYQELPELAKALQKLHGVPVVFGKVRVEYVLNGQAVEEDYYLSLYQFQANILGQPYVNWGPAWPPFALRAAKGQLDAKTPLLMSLAESIKVNPKWEAERQYVCQLFQQRLQNATDNAAALSKHIAANSQAISDMNAKSYAYQQAVHDKMAQKFSEAIMGVTSYKSPHSSYPVQLPSAYQYAWVSGNGQYIMSNNATFNPNVGSTQSWQLMKQAN